MGQNQSSEGVASEGKARKDTASASRRAGKSSPLRSSLSKHGKGSREPSLRSIQWAEQVATDMEHPRGMTTNASNSKKPRVRTRSEEEEYEKQLQMLQGECEEDTHRTLMSTDGENSIVLDEDEEISEFELLIVQELKLRVARGAKDPRSPRVKNLNSVLMKFPQIKAGFEDMRGIFTGVDADGSGDIDFEEWREALAANGLCVPEAHKLQVWREADVDGNNLIDFKEFVVAMSFLYLMHYVGLDEQTTLDLSASSQAKRLSLHEKVKTAIDLVVNAFLFFDKNGDGRILKDEVIKGLDTSIGVSGKKYGEGGTSQRIWRRRFAEMDCDKSGSISLKEFIFAFEDWVGFDDSDDDEEEE